MVLDQEQPAERTSLRRLNDDTLGDKAIRFGCGFTLALLVVLAVAMIGMLEMMDSASLVTATLVFAGACGVLSVIQGERVLEGLLKVIKWLA
jgi:hypothetical protein